MVVIPFSLGDFIIAHGADFVKGFQEKILVTEWLQNGIKSVHEWWTPRECGVSTADAALKK
jgi:hypothetical protein